MIRSDKTDFLIDETTAALQKALKCKIFLLHAEKKPSWIIKNKTLDQKHEALLFFALRRHYLVNMIFFRLQRDASDILIMAQ